MAVKLYMPSPFDRFRREGEIIGRMVIEYGSLEWDLCLLVSHVTEDLDIAVKTLYRSRGETQRIDIADALVRNRLDDARVRQTYETTLAHLRVCLKIRNHYAHANWLHAGSDKLAYIDIEELAKSNAPVEMQNMQLYHVDLQTVEDQARFFNEVMQNMRYLNMEIQYLKGWSTATGFHYVSNIARPRMAQRLVE